MKVVFLFCLTVLFILQPTFSVLTVHLLYIQIFIYSFISSLTFPQTVLTFQIHSVPLPCSDPSSFRSSVLLTSQVTRFTFPHFIITSLHTVIWKDWPFDAVSQFFLELCSEIDNVFEPPSQFKGSQPGSLQSLEPLWPRVFTYFHSFLASGMF